MSDILEDVLIVAGVGTLVYLWSTNKLPAAPGGSGSGGSLAVDPIQSAAQTTAAAVKQAGGTPAQQASAAQEVLNMRPLGGMNIPFIGNVGGIPPLTEVPGTGMTIFDLRQRGISDDDIWGLLQTPVQNAIQSATGITSAM